MLGDGREPARLVDVVLDQPDDEGDGGELVWHFALAACPPARFDRLLAEHPPELEDAQDGHVWNPGTFPEALVAASLLWAARGTGERFQPTGEQVAVFHEELPVDAWSTLVDAARELAEPPGIDQAVAELRASPRLQLEVATAAEYRIRHSELLAWPERDRLLAMAHLVESRARCPGCGVPERFMTRLDGAQVEVTACEWCAERDAELAELPEDRRASAHATVVTIRGA